MLLSALFYTDAVAVISHLGVIICMSVCLCAGSGEPTSADASKLGLGAGVPRADRPGLQPALPGHRLHTYLTAEETRRAIQVRPLSFTRTVCDGHIDPEKRCVRQ